MPRVHPPLCILLFFLVFILLPASSNAMGQKPTTITAGFKTITAWDPATGARIPVHVWYPSIRLERPVYLAPYTITVARFGKAAEEKHPVIIISHAMAESGLAHHTLARLLARRGFIVIAPTHPGDNMLDSNKIFTANQITDRPRHIGAALSALFKDSYLEPFIDTERVGIIGFGAGGTAALMLMGADPTPEDIPSYCAKAGENDPYCSRWAKPRLEGITRLSPPPGKTWRDKRISAAAIIAPAYGMTFTSQSFRRLAGPVLLVRAEQDTINQYPFHAEYIRSLLPQNTPYLVLKDATNYSLHSPCSKRMKNDYAVVCTDPPLVDRTAIHAELNNALMDFFVPALLAK